MSEFSFLVFARRMKRPFIKSGHYVKQSRLNFSQIQPQKKNKDSFKCIPDFDSNISILLVILDSFFVSSLCFSGWHVEVPPPAAGGEQEAGGADQDADYEEREAAAPQRSALCAFHSQHGLLW